MDITPGKGKSLLSNVVFPHPIAESAIALEPVKAGKLIANTVRSVRKNLFLFMNSAFILLQVSVSYLSFTILAGLFAGC